MTILDRVAALSSAHLADGALRVGVEVRCGPPEIVPIASGMRVAGPVRPVRHAGSVDVLLEAIDLAGSGKVLVVDNQGRRDEACIGDLMALETKAAGLSGMVVWGFHRDTPELLSIGIPVFTTGSLPTGPLRLDERDPAALISARMGEFVVTEADFVVGDDDGVVFLPTARLEEIVEAAEAVRDTERSQAALLVGGESIRDQLGFADYLVRRAQDPTYTFRQHLAARGGAIEA
jgi:regulator of RNase E activity RraA